MNQNNMNQNNEWTKIDSVAAVIVEIVIILILIGTVI